MPNTLLTISMITNEALYVLRNSLNFTKRVGREYSDKFGVEGAKIGTTLNIRKPPRYIGRTGPALSVENATEESVPVVLTTQFGVDINFTSADLLLSIDQFSKRFITPAIAAVANKIDYDGLQLYKKISQFVGTAAVVPILLSTYLGAGVKLDDSAAPMDGQRYLVVNPLMQASIVNALTGLFHSGEQIKKQYEKGTMGQAAGFEWAMDQNCPSHTKGLIAGTGVATVTGSNQVGSSILTGSWTNDSALKEGDLITFAAVYGVNPQSRQSTGALKQFRVTADVATSAGTGVMTIPIDPPIIVAGPLQTVTNSPAGGALISVFDFVAANFVTGVAGLTHREGMAFHKDAFTLATADLPLPNGVDMAARAADPDLGISIRLIRAYDINTDKFPCRLDVLYGWAALRPELACRIVS